MLLNEYTLVNYPTGTNQLYQMLERSVLYNRGLSLPVGCMLILCNLYE